MLYSELLRTTVQFDKIFKYRITVDWYDGLITGAYRRTETDNWILANLCFFNPKTNVRILTFLEVGGDDNALVQRLVELDYEPALTSIKRLFENNRSECLLCKYDSLNMKPLKVSKVEAKRIKFFACIEETLPENNQHLLVLKGIFPTLDISY